MISTIISCMLKCIFFAVIFVIQVYLVFPYLYSCGYYYVKNILSFHLDVCSKVVHVHRVFG